MPTFGRLTSPALCNRSHGQARHARTLDPRSGDGDALGASWDAAFAVVNLFDYTVDRRCSQSLIVGIDAGLIEVRVGAIEVHKTAHLQSIDAVGVACENVEGEAVFQYDPELMT